MMCGMSVAMPMIIMSMCVMRRSIGTMTACVIIMRWRRVSMCTCRRLMLGCRMSVSIMGVRGSGSCNRRGYGRLHRLEAHAMPGTAILRAVAIAPSANQAVDRNRVLFA